MFYLLAFISLTALKVITYLPSFLGKDVESIVIIDSSDEDLPNIPGEIFCKET